MKQGLHVTRIAARGATRLPNPPRRGARDRNAFAPSAQRRGGREPDPGSRLDPGLRRRAGGARHGLRRAHDARRALRLSAASRRGPTVAVARGGAGERAAPRGELLPGPPDSARPRRSAGRGRAVTDPVFDPKGATIAAIATGVRGGKLRARAVAEAYVERIAREDAALGSYVRVDAEGARRAADAVDAAVKAGRDPGPLAGVPLGIKDIFCTKGVETTCASKILRGFLPPYDSTETARLAAAGAESPGKPTMAEFAMGSSNENSADG